MRSPNPGAQRRFHFSLRRLMAAVAIIAILLAMFVPTARLKVDRDKPRLDDLVVMATLMLAEAAVVYYSVLAMVIARGLFNATKRVGTVRPFLTYGPLLATVASIAILQALDAFLCR